MKWKKQAASLLLAGCLAVSAVPTMAFATETETSQTDTTDTGTSETTTPSVAEMLQKAASYKYENDMSYTYHGVFGVTDTTINYTADRTVLTDKDGAVTQLSADLARFLGAIYRANLGEGEGATSAVTSITYNDKTYAWDANETLKGSNWVTGSDTDEENEQPEDATETSTKTTLVSAIRASWASNFTDEYFTAPISLKINDTDVSLNVTINAKEFSVGNESDLRTAAVTARHGDTIKLTSDIEVTAGSAATTPGEDDGDGQGTTGNQGTEQASEMAADEETTGGIAIGKDITLDGDSHKITAVTATADEDAPVAQAANVTALLTITNGANVTMKNLTIDSNKVVENGLVVETGVDAEEQTELLLQNVTILNSTNCGLVNNASVVTAENLVTEGNGTEGKGPAVNVNSGTATATFTMESGEITEEGSIVLDAVTDSADNTKVGKNTVTINGGKLEAIATSNENTGENNITVERGASVTEINTIASAGEDGNNAKNTINYYSGTVKKITTAADDKVTVTRPSTGGGGGSTTPTEPTDPTEPDDETCKKDSTCPISKFTDASAAAWYHDGVHYVLENSLMFGTGNNKFSPNATLTRAELAQILYNKAGKPAVNGASTFTDVPASAWYAKAVAWAQQNNVVSGVGGGKFAPNDKITREQIAVMLYNDAGKKAVTGTLNFKDAANVSNWAKDAMLWATQNKVVNGAVQSDGTLLLNPTNGATRAETAAMLANYYNK